MATNIGVNVVEVDGLGAPSVTGAATSVAAFNILTERGIPNTPQRVTAFGQFVERFGSYFSGGEGAYLVRGFFDNGGRTAYINRVADPAATPASLTLKDGAAVPLDTLRLSGGFRGTADPGAWARKVSVRTTPSSSASTRLAEASPATLTGTALVAPVDMGALTPLAIKIDGQATTIQFVTGDFVNAAQATFAEILAAINGKTSAMVATMSGANELTLTSAATTARLLGQFSSLEITAANAPLGLTVGPPVLGAAVALAAPGTRVADPSALKPGDAVTIEDDVAANTATAQIVTVDALTGDVTWTVAPANALNFADRHKVRVRTAEFDLEVATPDADHVVERHTSLSLSPTTANYAPRVMNHPLTGSKYLVATDLLSATPPALNRPAAMTAFTALALGTDPAPVATAFMGDPAAHTGFFAFDAYDVQLVTCERTDAAIALAGLAYCQGRDDAMYVGSVPEGSVEAGTAGAYTGPMQAAKRYGAMYGPQIIVADPIGVGDAPRITISPVGHIMGVYARIETARGIWKAPAGDEANLLGVLDVETRLSDADHTELVVKSAINGIRAIPRSGIVIDASRTLSTDPRWRYVNVRLLFNYVKSSLRVSLRGVRQEPNRDTLWSAIKFGTVTPFLLGLWRQGAFGTGSPEETFTVIVDESNNPPDEVQQGRLTVEVYFYPSNPAETIVIIVGQQPGGGSASEA
jgi:hypothetical protein